MNIFIVAGEPSGDEYGAKLIENICTINPKVNFYGIGGPLMEREGLNSIVPLEKMSVMGFMEIIKKLPFFIRLEKKIITTIKKIKPDKIILIDYPGLNLRLCKKIKATINTQIIYYISPQIWAWKEKRIETIKKYVDKMLVIFEFEKNWYYNKGVDVKFVGHPFLDVWKNDYQQLIDKYNIDMSKPILTLFPGSRKQEVNNHLDLFIKSALIIKNSIPELQILLGLHPSLTLNKSINKAIIVVQDRPLNTLQVASAAIISSGTATLQSAIMGTPGLVVYKMNVFSWWLTKRLVKVKFASMVNIVADDWVFPELLQNEANIENVVAIMRKMFLDKKYQGTLHNKIKLIQNKLGGAGASKKAAEYILGF